MQLNEEQLIKLAKSKGVTDQQIAEARAGRMLSQFGQKQQPSGGERVGGAVQGALRGLLSGHGMQPDTIMGKSETDYSDDLNKVYATEAIKSQFRPQNQNYLLDEKGEVVPLPTGRIVQRPYGLSGVAQDRFEGRQDESSANREAGLLKAGYVPDQQQSMDNGEVSVNIG